MTAGRKKKYDAEKHPQLAESYAKAGYSDKQIASMLGIAEGTLYDWENKYPEFSKAIKRGKEPANEELKVSMMKTATGYYVEEEETVARLDPDKQVLGYTKVVKKKYIPPNSTMQIFLAKNRMPEEYRDVNRHEVDMRGQITLAELMMEDANRD